MRYEYDHLGEDPEIIKKITNGSHDFAKKWKNAKKPVIIIGSDALERKDGGGILTQVQILAKQAQACIGDHDWKVLNVLHKVASQVAALDLGYKPGVEAIRNMDVKVLFLLGADENVISREDLPRDCFVVYQGINFVFFFINSMTNF